MASVWNYVYFHLCTAQLRTMTRAESNVSRWGRGHRVSEIVGYWPDFQWANQQRYSDLRPVWEGTEGTDDGGLGQALSSDSQMDAVDWLGGGRSKPQPCLPRGPSCLRRQEPRRVSRASFTKAWKLLLLSLRLSCEGKTQWQIAWLETYSKCNKTQLSLRAR